MRSSLPQIPFRLCFLAIIVLLASQPGLQAQTASPAPQQPPAAAKPTPVPARQITGFVRLGNRPAPAGITVSARIVFRDDEPHPTIVQAKTDSIGKFVLDHLETLGANQGRENFALSAIYPGYDGDVKVVDLTESPSGETTLELTPERTANRAAAAPNSTDRFPVDREKIRKANLPQVQQAMDRGQELLFRQRNPQASTEEFRQAIKLDPFYAPGYLLLGLAYMQTANWSEAQWAFEEAQKVEPGNAQGYLGAGSAMNEQKNYAGAQKALERSLELRPESAEAHYELARTFSALGKWDPAEAHVRRAIELNPDYAGPHVLMANIYLQQENAEEALAEYKEYLRLDPNGSMAPAARDLVKQISEALAADEPQPTPPRKR
jgi:cytochrome c-type biogenesis protein CcmH/NrfG